MDFQECYLTGFWGIVHLYGQEPSSIPLRDARRTPTFIVSKDRQKLVLPLSCNINRLPLSFYYSYFHTKSSVTTFVTDNVLITQNGFCNAVNLTGSNAGRTSPSYSYTL